ncbi:MAG TPA: aspartate aminotransferase family protein [Gaiellales bacterium]|nr:aspartate aminotransferase family protein [Gaiellales bacterium]
MLASTVDRVRLADLAAREERRFGETHPRSRELFERAGRSLLAGVPMHWMTEWAGAFPVFVSEASGARFVDVDGNEYVDLCLGDTGAMTGHAPAAAADAVSDQVRRGTTLMLPTEDAMWVAEEMGRRFGLPFWQFALTATDANRFTIRLARAATGRTKVLVHNWCYHGSVDESFAVLADGEVEARPYNIGPPVDPSQTTRVVEINDLEGLERELAHGDVACCLFEPALTNVGIVLPEPGYHEGVRELTRRYGALLVIDETHCICAGPGGYTGAHRLKPDFVTIGKPLASGVPAAAYGMSEETARRVIGALPGGPVDVGGIGGTLAGNALSLRAMRATLEHVLTAEAFARMIPLAERFTDGVEAAIDRHGLAWYITRLGCRAEYGFQRERPRTGGEAAASMDHELDRFMHLYALNRGVLMTPFHNMALMSPATTDADVDRHTDVFTEALAELTAAA